MNGTGRSVIALFGAGRGTFALSLRTASGQTAASGTVDCKGGPSPCLWRFDRAIAPGFYDLDVAAQARQLQTVPLDLFGNTVNAAAVLAAPPIPMTAAPGKAPLKALSADIFDTVFKTIGYFWQPAQTCYEKARPYLQEYGILTPDPKSSQLVLLETVQAIQKSLEQFSQRFDAFAKAYNEDVAAKAQVDLLKDVGDIRSRTSKYADAVAAYDGNLDAYLNVVAGGTDRDKFGNDVIDGILRSQETRTLKNTVEALSEPRNLDYLAGLLRRSLVDSTTDGKGVNKMDRYNAYNAAILFYDTRLLAAMEEAYEIERLALYLRYKSPHNKTYQAFIALSEDLRGAKDYDGAVKALRDIFNDRERTVGAHIGDKAIDFNKVLPAYGNYRASCDITFFDDTDIKANCEAPAGKTVASRIEDIAKTCLADDKGGAWQNREGYLTCATPVRPTAFDRDHGYVRLLFGEGMAVELDGATRSIADDKPYLHYEVLDAGNGAMSMTPQADGTSMRLKIKLTGLAVSSDIVLRVTPMAVGRPTTMGKRASREPLAPPITFALRGAATLTSFDGNVRLACVQSACSLPVQPAYATRLDFAPDTRILLDYCGDDFHGPKRLCLSVTRPGWPKR